MGRFADFGICPLSRCFEKYVKKATLIYELHSNDSNRHRIRVIRADIRAIRVAFINNAKTAEKQEKIIGDECEKSRLYPSI